MNLSTLPPSRYKLHVFATASGGRQEDCDSTVEDGVSRRGHMYNEALRQDEKPQDLGPKEQT